MSTVSTIKHALDIVKINFKESKRSDKVQFRLATFVIAGMVLIWSLIIGFFYYMWIAYPEQAAQSESPLHIFTYIHLVLFILLFYYGLVNTVGGLFHPFFMNDKTAGLLLRIPVKSGSLYLSTMFQGILKSLVFPFAYSIPFVTILVLGNFPWYHYFLSFLALWLGILQIMFLLYFLFFLTTPIRRKISSIDFLYDTSSIAMNVVMLVPIVIGFLGLTQDYYPTFDLLADYLFLPLVNTSISFSGLFLRAGIPKVTIFAFASQVIYIVVIFMLNTYFAKKYRFQEEVEVTISKYTTASVMQSQLTGGKKQDFELLPDLSPSTFVAKPPLISLLYKDWLVLKRTKKGDRFIYSSLFIVPLAWFVILSAGSNNFIYFIAFLLLYHVITLFQILMNMEQEILIDRSYVDDKMIKQEKFLIFLIIHLFVLSPLWLLNFWIVVGCSIVFSFIFAIFYNSSVLRSTYGHMIFIIIYSVMFGLLSLTGDPSSTPG